MGRLLLLFIALPAVELVLLIEVGRRIGTVATLALIVVTGAIGAALARQQGLGVLAELRRETESSGLPAGALIDGALILVAAALLVTPGILTDALGFACLVPALRAGIKRSVRRWIERAVREGRIQVQVETQDAWGPRVEREVHDVREQRLGDRPRGR